MNREKTTQGDPNQGEGDRVSARHYNEQARKFVEDGKVDPAARDAEAYVEKSPGDAARAERKAKHGPRSTRVAIDDLLAMTESAIERIRPVALRAIGKLRARLGRK
jgi:hypothetical protein